MSSLTAEQTQALEDLRQRLFGLSRNLNSLRTLLATSLPTQYVSHSLDTPSTTNDSPLNRARLQSAATTTTASLTELSRTLTTHSSLLSRLIALPNANFPVHTHWPVIEALLATHLSLPVQEWVEAGVSHAQSATEQELLDDEDRKRLWNEAGAIAVGEARKQRWGADYTLEEVRRGVGEVRTGLRRELVVPDEEEEEDDEEEGDEFEEDESEDEGDEQAAGAGEKMDVDAKSGGAARGGGEAKVKSQQVPLMSLDVLLKFASTGKDG